MFLRKLTDDEIEKIKKSKDAANKVIKEQRKKLQAEIKEYGKLHGYHRKALDDLERKLEEFAVVTGHPVIITNGDRSIRVNYTLLKKIESSLNRSNLWQIDSEIKGGPVMVFLTIRYRGQAQEGWMEIFELPRHQVELLPDLPVISLDEIEYAKQLTKPAIYLEKPKEKCVGISTCGSCDESCPIY